MKKLTFFIFLLAAITGMGQNKVFDTITFIRGGKLYRILLWGDSLKLNENKYYSFPGFGTTHVKSAFGDHAHSGIYEPVIGIGTTNQYWSGDKTWQTLPSVVSSQWTTSGSNIYYNSGNVGVGLTNPSYKFHVEGTIRATVTSGNTGVYGATYNGAGVFGYAPYGKGVYGSAAWGTAIYGETTSGYSGIFMGGNVGIGISNPSRRLHVVSDTNAIYAQANNGGVGVYAYSSAGTGISGASNSGTGVVGTSGSGSGVYGASANIGVYGTTSSANGKGIYGSNQLSAGIAVYGTAAIGYGIYGLGLYGVLGSSTTGVGGYFQVTGGSGTALIAKGVGSKVFDFCSDKNSIIDSGMMMAPNGNIGIGNTNPTAKLEIVSSGSTYGLISSATSGYAIQGMSGSGIGVAGSSTNLYGIGGISQNSYGGYFRSTNSYALYSLGRTWLDSTIYIRRIPITSGATRYCVWDSLTKELRVQAAPTFSMTYPGAGIAISTGSAWGTSITDNSANWNTAYGWGNHASAGYLTSYTETDPLVFAWAKSATKPTYTYSEVGAEPAISKSTGFLKWNGSAWTWDNSTYVSSQWTTSGSDIYYMNKVSIGGSVSDSSFKVYGGGNFGGGLKVYKDLSIAGNYPLLTLGTDGADVASKISFTADGTERAYISQDMSFDETLKIGNSSTNHSDITLNTVSGEKLRLTPDGKIGIGTTAPATTLDVNGTSTLPTILGGSDVVSGITYTSTSGIGSTTGIAHSFKGGTNGGTVIQTMLNNGKVGIGTTSPGAVLDVNSSTMATNLNLNSTLAVSAGTGPQTISQVNMSYLSNTYYARNVLRYNRDNTHYEYQTTLKDPGATRIMQFVDLTTGDYFLRSGITTCEFQNTSYTAFGTNAGSNVGIGTTSPTAKLDVSSDIIRLRTAKTPASATATGNAGDICWDANYIYICTATNTWKRSAISTW
jgi:hypothetical protein